MADLSVLLSIWDIDEWYFDLSENTFVEITSVSASCLHGTDVLLTTNGGTKIRNIYNQVMTEAHMAMQRKCYDLADIGVDSFMPQYNEFDVVAYVLDIGPISNNNFQTVYFVDSRRNILLLKFWIGIKQYAYDDIIKKGKMLAIAILEWRRIYGKSQSNWPQAYVSNLTIFSDNPKPPAMIERLHQLSNSFKQMIDKAAYIEECIA